MSDDPPLSSVRQARDKTISLHECRAIRALDRSDDYTRSEIAFMFETRTRTIKAHIEYDCDHARERATNGTGRIHTQYSDDALLTAFQAVYDKQPYQRMSQDVYDEYADPDDPSSSAILNRFDGWQNARQKAFPNRSESNE